jgi:hypothetical protein
MSTHALHHAGTVSWPRWLIAGLVSGFVAVLIFHQGAAALLHAMGWTPRTPYATQAVPPFGVPQVLSLACWGALWGAVLAAALARLRGGALIAAATVFGAVLPTLVAWFVVAPLKGQPAAAGFAVPAMFIGPIVNAAWGFGTGLGLAVLSRSRRQPTTEAPPT